MGDEQQATRLLVEVIDTEPTVIAENGVAREFRRVSSMFRGPELESIRSLLNLAVTTKDRSDARIHRRAGSRPATAIPVLAADNSVAAVHVTIGDNTTAGDGHESVGVYEWEPVDDLPPRLLLSPEFLDLFGIDDGYRDRNVFGPADFFTRTVLISDIVRMIEDVHNAKQGERHGGTFVIRRDDGELRLIHYAQRCISTPSGDRIRGICRDATSTVDLAALRISLLDHELSRTIIGLQGMYGIIVDVTYPDALCILKWLTSYIPGIGHGVSTGQTPGIHPDDYHIVLDGIIAARRGESARGEVRHRRGGGGWIKSRFIAQALDIHASNRIGVAMIYPDSITVDAPTEPKVR